MDTMLRDSFVRFLQDVCPLTAVRRAEADGDVADILRNIDESGFLDGLIPETKGGSGLALAEVLPLFVAAGEHLLPIPFAETMLARALIAHANAEAPSGRAIILWPTADRIRRPSLVDPLTGHGSLALVQTGVQFELLPTLFQAPAMDPFHLPSAQPDMNAPAVLRFTAPEINLQYWAAAISSAYMAGALGGMLRICLTYVNERMQFGRTLSKFQAIQQQLSVFSERCATAHVAARIAFIGCDLVLNRTRVAVAKSVANESARICVSIAHAVHGAIGISAAHSLQLYARRLSRWQLNFGSETYWQRQIGVKCLNSDEATSVDFVRTLIQVSSL